MNSTTGYWGPVTASIDWCEPNYVVSHYIAEFWNTISNFMLILLPILGYIHYTRYNFPFRYKLMALMCITIGLGSALFHGTLLFYCQLADELPMLWSGLCILYVNFEDSKEIKYPNLPYYLIIFGFLWTFASPWTHLYYPIWFEVLFGIMQLSVCIKLIMDIKRFGSSKTLICFFLYFFFGVFAFACWNIDTIYCSDILNSRVGQSTTYKYVGSLHGWWHVFISIHALLGSLIINYMYWSRLGKKAEYVWELDSDSFFLPHVRPQHKHE
eukprot:TRINITY_DN3645_c0_g1_i1.p1 TRINITY_DN3645_c0_g1~~TRINITY_DN3645_c0_g1_i1.p1  ORF type:complete len:269 (-),score=6.23 TRINITY_DN3645_c0_g1_i1:123-929(-)